MLKAAIKLESSGIQRTAHVFVLSIFLKYALLEHSFIMDYAAVYQ
ncbi:hypothetical protein X975_27065, partial [Stegodyphus mimosarum]